MITGRQFKISQTQTTIVQAGGGGLSQAGGGGLSQAGGGGLSQSFHNMLLFGYVWCQVTGLVSSEGCGDKTVLQLTL